MSVAALVPRPSSRPRPVGAAAPRSSHRPARREGRSTHAAQVTRQHARREGTGYARAALVASRYGPPGPKKSQLT